MEIKDINSIFWKNEDGTTALVKDLDKVKLQEIYNIVQARQFKAYNMLELTCKMQNAIVKTAKSKKLELISIEHQKDITDKIRNRYFPVKALIGRIDNSIKLFLNKQENGNKD